MKKARIISLTALSVFAVMVLGAGCAHKAHNRGSVVVKHGASEADVCLGDKEVSVGDRMAIYRHDCKRKSLNAAAGDRGPRTTLSCQKVKVGEGEIVQVLDEHYSTMRADSGISLSEGLSVEKL